MSFCTENRHFLIKIIILNQKLTFLKKNIFTKIHITFDPVDGF